MSASPDSCCDFAGSYELSRLPEIKKLEQVALGCDYGGTSWTTRQQAEGILESLQLASTNRLLDIGSGAGWPGLLLGKLSSCDVTLLDIPLNALAQAAARAVDDGMTDRVSIVSASGTALPFDDQTFDRISHSDVLCCLPEKLELLQESRRVASDNARMHFSVILPSEGLPQCQDVTAEYRNSLQRLVDGINENKKELADLLGEDELIGKREHREDQIALITNGSMRREAFVAIAA